MITISFCSIAFRDEALLPLLPEIRKWGFDSVEAFAGQLEVMSDSELTGLRSRAEDLGLTFLAVAPYFWFTQNEELRRKSMAIAERTIHQARLLGADKIRTFTDSGPTGIGSDVATAEQWDQAVGSLRDLSAMAPELTFVIETHPQTLADTAASALQVLDRVGAANLKLLFQPSHTLWIPEFERLFPHIEHLHLHDLDAEGTPCPPGEGTLALPSFLQTLTASGYQGSLSLEYCWRGATRAQVAAGKQFLDRYLK